MYHTCSTCERCQRTVRGRRVQVRESLWWWVVADGISWARSRAEALLYMVGRGYTIIMICMILWWVIAPLWVMEIRGDSKIGPKIGLFSSCVLAQNSSLPYFLSSDEVCKTLPLLLHISPSSFFHFSSTILFCKFWEIKKSSVFPRELARGSIILFVKLKTLSFSFTYYNFNNVKFESTR